MPANVHIFVEFDPRRSLHDVVKKLKDKTAHVLRKEYPELVRKLPSMWTRSYLACSVIHINEDNILKYIEEQNGK
ncbi:IS200/IS605 family transposase [Thomasclavelia spiroformis]|uniref:IS200/IS605 family transposase n=1 Tax=Bacillota TaxID=1239 RepID=UPI0039920AE0